MKRLAWLLVALGTLLVQVQPVRATLRRSANSECCRQARACCEHPAESAPAPADEGCSVCVPGCAGCAIMPALDFFLGSVAAPARLFPRDECGEPRRDPPPLPPPR